MRYIKNVNSILNRWYNEKLLTVVLVQKNMFFFQKNVIHLYPHRISTNVSSSFMRCTRAPVVRHQKRDCWRMCKRNEIHISCFTLIIISSTFTITQPIIKYVRIGNCNDGVRKSCFEFCNAFQCACSCLFPCYSLYLLLLICFSFCVLARFFFILSLHLWCVFQFTTRLN